MLNIERTKYIREELDKLKSVTVEELSKKYFVSPSTIRRDLQLLEQEGIVRRTYGGAVLIEKDSNEIPYALRRSEETKEKKEICQLAAMLVKDDMYICLDTTSTVAQLPQYLSEKKDLKIITPSIQIANECIDMSNANIYVAGGWLNRISRGCTGENTRNSMAEFYNDILFFSARSISMEHGVTDVNEEDISLKKIMIESTRKVVMLATLSKFDQVSYKKVCELNKLDTIVTNRKPDDNWILYCEQHNIQLLYPQK